MLEQTQNSAPVAPTIVGAGDYTSKRDPGDWTIAKATAMADAQNQLNMAKYNNDYNYWLWQQQTAYNSPEQQVARLKRAGLNPNFNSIEGAGNASSPSPSSGSLKTNFLGAYQANIAAREMKIQQANSIVNGLNSLVKNIGEGFRLVDSYANIPNNITEYRNLMMQTLRNTVELGGKNITRADKAIENMTHNIAIAMEREKMFKYQTGSNYDIAYSPYARNFQANTRLKLAQAGLIDKQGNFVDWQAKKVASDILVNQFKANMLKAQAGYYGTSSALNNARRINVEYEGRSLLPAKVRILNQQFNMLGKQLERTIYDNSLMKFDKWFDYGLRTLYGVSGAVRTFSPFMQSSGLNVPGYYSPYNY